MAAYFMPIKSLLPRFSCGDLVTPLNLSAFVWLLFFTLSPLTALRIDWATFWPMFSTVIFLTLLYGYYHLNKRDERLSALIYAALSLILFSCAAELCNYLGFYIKHPLYDDVLEHIDHAIGFDWWAYVHFVKSNPISAQILTYAYNSSQAQIICVIIVLAYMQQFRTLRLFILTFMLAAMISIVFCSVVPSMGALQLRYMNNLPLPDVPLALGEREVSALVNMHKGIIPVLVFDQLIGLIGCPSFHTIISLLIIYAVRDFNMLRLIAYALNIIVLISVPADGGHHLIDMIGGGIVAFISIVIAHRIMHDRRDLVNVPLVAMRLRWAVWAGVPAPYQP
jgi:PAP2 superfamily